MNLFLLCLDLIINVILLVVGIDWLRRIKRVEADRLVEKKYYSDMNTSALRLCRLTHEKAKHIEASFQDVTVTLAHDIDQLREDLEGFKNEFEDEDEDESDDKEEEDHDEPDGYDEPEQRNGRLA